MKKKSIKVSKNVQNIKKRQKSIKALKKYLTPFRKSYAVIETNVRPRLKLMPKPKSLISKLEAIHKEMRKLFLKSKQTNISKKIRKINKILLDKKIIKKEKLVRILYLKDKTGLKTGLTKFVKKLTKIRFIQKTPEKRKISLRLRIRETIRKKKIKRQLRYGKYRRYHKYHKKNKYQGKKSPTKKRKRKKKLKRINKIRWYIPALERNSNFNISRKPITIMSKIFRKTVRKQRLSRYQEQTLEAYQFHKRREGLRRFKQKREVYGKRTVVLNKKILRAFKLCKTQLLKKKNIEFFNITRKPRNTVKNARLRRKYRNKWILFHAGLAKIRKTRKLYGLNNLIRSRQPIRREIPALKKKLAKLTIKKKYTRQFVNPNIRHKIVSKLIRHLTLKKQYQEKKVDVNPRYIANIVETLIPKVTKQKEKIVNHGKRYTRVVNILAKSYLAKKRFFSRTYQKNRAKRRRKKRYMKINRKLGKFRTGNIYIRKRRINTFLTLTTRKKRVRYTLSTGALEINGRKKRTVHALRLLSNRFMHEAKRRRYRIFYVYLKSRTGRVYKHVLKAFARRHVLIRMIRIRRKHSHGRMRPRKIKRK